MGKKCFVISVIGDKGSEERRHADLLFDHIIKPVAEQAGYDTVKRGDHFDETGMITAQVVEAILNDDMVVADLTYDNPNVYYELAIRHQTGKPIVQMMKEGVKLPFDLAHVRTLTFGMDLDEAEEAKKELSQKIEVAEKDTQVVKNPITQAREINALKLSPLDQAETLSSILETQNAILSGVNALSRKLSGDVDSRRPVKLDPSVFRDYTNVLKAYELDPKILKRKVNILKEIGKWEDIGAHQDKKKNKGNSDDLEG